MKKIDVRLAERSYSILIGRNLLPQLGNLLKPLRLGSKILIVSNPKVAKFFLKPVRESLKKAGFEVAAPYLLSHGNERDKSSDSLNRLWQHMGKVGLERSSTVLALGGGVVGDLTGFAASTYMRGIAVVQVPTTLLAQVDAAIGGKTAIDLRSAKNMVGTFYQPRLVIADVNTLDPLIRFRNQELRNGFAEVIKYGMIADAELFQLLEERLVGFLNSISKKSSLRDSELSFLETIVWRSARIKAKIVSEDEYEKKGKRLILNYGHTFAHAFEAASGYRMPHGEAVALGMVCAARLATTRGLLPKETERRQNQLIQHAGLPVKTPKRFKVDQLMRSMMLDKKKKDGKLRFILPEAVGRVRVVDNVSPSEIKSVLTNLD